MSAELLALSFAIFAVIAGLSIKSSRAPIETAMKQRAKTIANLYISPSHRTDFAILFLPTEGLYAEVLKRPGLANCLQSDYRVTIAGPMNLAALLSALQLGVPNACGGHARRWSLASAGRR
jgi:DNA anti-recombination protein RmuC